MLTRRTTTEADRTSPDAAARATGLKLQAIADDLNVLFLERTEAIGVLVTALAGGFPTALISAPGTAKTALIDELYGYVDGETFGWLMTRYTTPDELFGAPSLKALSEDDELRRNLDGKLARARTVKLDEGFKANSATLNAQLEALNEKRFEGTPTPWTAWIAASNEYPDGIASGRSDGDSLGALWDRYVLRVELDYLASEANVEALLFGVVDGDRADKVTADELAHMQAEVGKVWIPQAVRDAILELRRALLAEGMTISDRSWKRATRCIQARALANGRDSAKLADLTILAHSLWETPSQREKVAELVRAVGAPQLAVALAAEADVAPLARAFREATGAEMQGKGHELTTRIASHVAALEGLDIDDDEIADEVDRVINYLDGLRGEVANAIFAKLRGKARTAAELTR